LFPPGKQKWLKRKILIWGPFKRNAKDSFYVLVLGGKKIKKTEEGPPQGKKKNSPQKFWGKENGKQI